MQTIYKPTIKNQITFKEDNLDSYLPNHPSTILNLNLWKRDFPTEVAASIGAVWYCTQQSSTRQWGEEDRSLGEAQSEMTSRQENFEVWNLLEKSGSDSETLEGLIWHESGNQNILECIISSEKGYLLWGEKNKDDFIV